MGPLAWTPADFFLKALVLALTRLLRLAETVDINHTVGKGLRVFHLGKFGRVPTRPEATWQRARR